jgi:hypothetical protein
MKKSMKHSIAMGLLVSAWGLVLAPVAGYGDDFNKGSRSQEKGQIDKTRTGDRGEAGINIGGQVTPPGEGDQSGRPGTIFGAPATLPPNDEAVQYEGADKAQKKGKAPTEGGPR